MAKKTAKAKKSIKTFRISGHIIDSRTYEGVEELRIEAWSKGGKSSNPISSTATDANGAFEMEFEYLMVPPVDAMSNSIPGNVVASFDYC